MVYEFQNTIIVVNRDGDTFYFNLVDVGKKPQQFTKLEDAMKAARKMHKELNRTGTIIVRRGSTKNVKLKF